MKETRICPLCNKKYDKPPALSRKDNKTEVCPTCGFREAMEIAEKVFGIKRGGTKQNGKGI